MVECTEAEARALLGRTGGGEPLGRVALPLEDVLPRIYREASFADAIEELLTSAVEDVRAAPAKPRQVSGKASTKALPQPTPLALPPKPESPAPRRRSRSAEAVRR